MIDTTAPDLTIDSIKYANGTIEPSKFVTNYNTPTILGTTSADVTNIELVVGGHTYTPTLSETDWEVDITNAIPNGLHTMSIVATDLAGNATTKTQDIKIDTVAPTAVYQQYDGTTEVTGTIAYVNDLARLSFTSEYTDTGFSAGLHSDSYVIFEAQNDGSFGFSADGKKAYCSWRSSPNLVNLSGSTYSLETYEQFTNCEPSLADGGYYMTHQVADSATRKDIPSINQFRDVLGLHFVIDTEEPTSTINLPSGGTVEGLTVFTSTWTGGLTGTASDNNGVTDVLLSIQRDDTDAYWNGTGWVADLGTEVTFSVGNVGWNYNLPSSEVTDGVTYTVWSHAVDIAGNIENTYKINIVVDKSIDEVKLTVDPTDPDGNNGWYKTKPVVILEIVDDNFKILRYKWDDGAWEEKDQTIITINIPGEGSHILRYQAIDKAGNETQIGTKTIRWDETSLEEGPQNISVSPNPTSGTTATVSWDAASDGITIDKYEIIWQLDGTSTQHSKTVNSTTFETEIDQLTEGKWNIKVKAYDGVGNSKEGSVTLVVDKTAPNSPALTLDSTDVGTANLSWNAVDDAEEYLIFYGITSGDYIYGANVGNVTSYTVQGLGAGNYYFIVRAKDAADNQSGNSNEVNTGVIAGVPGATPGGPAEGFIPAGEVQGAATEETEFGGEIVQPEGKVQGISDTTSWLKYNLPWILLILQAAFILLADNLMRHKRGFLKHSITLLVTILAIIIFNWLVNPDIYSPGSLMLLLTNGFVWISVGLALLLKVFNYAFVEEIAS